MSHWLLASLTILLFIEGLLMRFVYNVFMMLRNRHLVVSCWRGRPDCHLGIRRLESRKRGQASLWPWLMLECYTVLPDRLTLAPVVRCLFSACCGFRLVLVRRRFVPT